MPKRKLLKRSPPVSIPIPRWAAIIYFLFCIVLVPWTINLSLTLPTHHLSPHWDISWTGLDVGIIITLLITAYLAYKKSKWVTMPAIATSVLLIADAWFDIMSSHAGTALDQAIILAIFVELPVSIMSFLIAYHVLDKNID